MTQTANEVLTLYQVRKTKKQKQIFAEYVEKKARENGYVCTREKGSFGSENLLVGDVDSAKVIYTAHYDTCPRLPFPNFITPKNIGIYILYQIALTLAIFAVVFAADFVIGFLIGFFGASMGVTDEELLISIASLASTVVWIVMLFLLISGPANKHTVNDNTSGVITLLDTMAALPEALRPHVAFVFFDLEEAGMIGSSSFAKKHAKMLVGKPVVNYDCVSDGETVLLCPNKQARGFVPYLEKAFVNTAFVTVDIATKGVFYPSDQMRMPCGIGVAALKKTKRGLLYMDRIHTNRDVIFREENISYLCEASISFATVLME